MVRLQAQFQGTPEQMRAEEMREGREVRKVARGLDPGGPRKGKLLVMESMLLGMCVGSIATVLRAGRLSRQSSACPPNLSYEVILPFKPRISCVRKIEPCDSTLEG